MCTRPREDDFALLILENRASAGGVVYAYDYNYGSSGDVHIQSEDSLFEHNSAASSTYRDWENHGGVHYLYGKGAKSYSSGDRFDNNSATDEGGVCYCQADASLNVSGSTFRANSAESGGVLSVFYLSAAVLVRSTFLHNRATSEGGVAYMRYYARLESSESVYRENSAPVGGCVSICCSDSGYQEALVSHHDLFENNRADESGGAWGLRGQEWGSGMWALINGSRFDANTARRGGAIYFSHGYLRANFSYFVNNSASAGGGGAVNFYSSSYHEYNYVLDCRCTIAASLRAIEPERDQRVGGAVMTRDSPRATTFHGFRKKQAGLLGAVMVLGKEYPVSVSMCAATRNNTGRLRDARGERAARRRRVELFLRRPGLLGELR